MKKTFAFIWIVAGLLCSSVPGRGQESAVVTENKINVRGQPSFVGEVLTQLERGESVVILERLKVENPKPGEPEAWAKIKLPANTPVWVFAPFIKDGSVAASRLNVRGGPGENYSVVGRLDRGTQVTEIRVVEEWMEIQAPEGAYAFVDASLLKSTGGTPAPTAAAAPVAAAEAATPPEAEPAAPQPAEAAPEPKVTEPVAKSAESKPPSESPSPAPETASNQAATTPPPEHRAGGQQETPPQQPATPAETPSPEPAAAAAPVAASPASRPVEPLPQVADPLPQREPVPGRRVVTREGVVRSTKSIQAPTWFELAHPETKKTINYLHPERLGIKLDEYKGLRVRVTGEEGIDPRWPNTPLLEMQSIEVAP